MKPNEKDFMLELGLAIDSINKKHRVTNVGITEILSRMAAGAGALIAVDNKSEDGFKFALQTFTDEMLAQAKRNGFQELTFLKEVKFPVVQQ